MNAPDGPWYRIRAFGAWGQTLYPETFDTLDAARAFIQADKRAIITERYAIWYETPTDGPEWDTWEVESVEGGAKPKPSKPKIREILTFDEQGRMSVSWWIE